MDIKRLSGVDVGKMDIKRLSGVDVGVLLREARRREDWSLVDRAMALLGERACDVSTFAWSLLMKVAELYEEDAVAWVERDLSSGAPTYPHRGWWSEMLRRGEDEFGFVYPPAHISATRYGVADGWDMVESFHFAVAERLVGTWEEYTVTGLLDSMRDAYEEEHADEEVSYTRTFAQWMREEESAFRNQLFAYLETVDEHPYGIGTLGRGRRESMSDWPVERYIALASLDAERNYRDATGKKVTVGAEHEGHFLACYSYGRETPVLHCTECDLEVA